MSKLVAVALIALAALSLVSAAPIFPRQNVSSGWDSENQEVSPYDVFSLDHLGFTREPSQGYNARFLALGCQNQQNTQFFDDCCHPLKQGQTLGNNCSNPPSTPSGAPSNILISKPPSQTTEPIFVRDMGDDCEDDETCDDDDENCDPSSSSVNEPPLTPTSSVPVPEKTLRPTPTPTSSPGPSPSSSTDNATPSSTPSNSETHTDGVQVDVSHDLFLVFSPLF